MNIDCFASVWDVQSVNFMSDYTDVGKVPSAHLNNFDLVAYARERFKTLMISTAFSNENEIISAINSHQPNVVFHSVGSYPTETEDANLSYINHLAELPFTPNVAVKNCYGVGYSGHEIDPDVTIASWAIYDAMAIEKHVTLDREMWGSDQKSSITFDEYAKIIKSIETMSELTRNNNKYRVLLDCEKEKEKTLKKE